MKRAVYLAVVVVTLVLGVGVALAQPMLPHSVGGTVSRVGGGAAPDGAIVYGTVGDYTSPKDSDARVRGGKYFITLGPPAGSYAGQTISIWVDEDGNGPLPPVEARFTGVLVFKPAGQNVDLNITYTQPTPPTPTPTATPKPTETPKPGGSPTPGPTATPTLPAAGTNAFFYLALAAAVLGLAGVMGGAWAWRKGRARA